MYEGQWKAGRYFGRGKYTSVNSDGQALECAHALEFQIQKEHLCTIAVHAIHLASDRAISRPRSALNLPTLIQPSRADNGEWINDKMEGHGQYVYKSTGDIYEGGFVNGFREGFGKYYKPNGDIYIGEYVSGELRSKEKLDRTNMQTGTDENGLRIRLFTATATGERALKAGLGKV